MERANPSSWTFVSGDKSFDVDEVKTTSCLTKNYYAGVEGCSEVEGILWDRHFATPVKRFSDGHEDYIRMVAVEPRTERTAVTVSADGQVQIWRSLEEHKRISKDVTS